MISGDSAPVVFLQSQSSTGAEMLGAVQTFIMLASALAAGAAAWVAWRTYRAGAIPKVVAYLTSDTDVSVVYLNVKNIGGGTAYDISIEIEDGFYMDSNSNVNRILESGFIAKGIPMLVPGDSRKTYIASSRDFAQHMEHSESKAIVAFSTKPGGRKKTETCILDSYSFRSLYTDSFAKRAVVALEKIAGSK